MDMQKQSSSAAVRRVTVYASSSNALAESYYDAASRLGRVLGKAGLEIIYGGRTSGTLNGAE